MYSSLIHIIKSQSSEYPQNLVAALSFYIKTKTMKTILAGVALLATCELYGTGCAYCSEECIYQNFPGITVKKWEKEKVLMKPTLLKTARACLQHTLQPEFLKRQKRI